MKYFLQMVFGDSETFFSSLDSVLSLQGSRQGNKGSPAFWLAVSAFLVAILHHLAHVAQIISAMSHTVLKAVGFLFVEDTDLMMTVAKLKSESPEQVSSPMQARQQLVMCGMGACMLLGVP